jgi:hypothetical protein
MSSGLIRKCTWALRGKWRACPPAARAVSHVIIRLGKVTFGVAAFDSRQWSTLLVNNQPCSALSARRRSAQVVCYGESERMLSFEQRSFGSCVFERRKTPWRLSPTRKANQRKRLKRVDSVVEAVRASGVECGALVSSIWSDLI